MSKKILPRLIVGLSFLAAAVLFLLSELMPDQFGGFNLAWAGLIFSGASGLALLLSALFTKNSVALKKLQILLSAILLIVAVLCLVSALALPKNLVLPIILVVAAALLVLSILFTGGKKWDEGDNHKVGYKNYYQRKAEEEKNKSDDQQEHFKKLSANFAESFYFSFFTEIPGGWFLSLFCRNMYPFIFSKEKRVKSLLWHLKSRTILRLPRQ